MLVNMLIRNHAEIVARARLRAAQRRAPRASDEQLKHGIPLFLRQLAKLMSGTDSDLEALSRTATQHGEELLRSGFSVAQVVHGYGDVCQAVAEVAGELDVPIRVEELRVFNCCLDEAVAQALSEYARLHELSIAAKGTEPMGVFAHELRTLISGAALAFDTLRDGHVPASGKTAAALGRSLQRMRELVDRSLAEVRLQAHLHHP
jgi:signal transduction histidine kinase